MYQQPLDTSGKENVDKSIVVMGGFEKLGETQKVLETLLSHVRGFKDVRITDSLADITLAKFDCPTGALAFARGHKGNKQMQEMKL